MKNKIFILILVLITFGCSFPAFSQEENDVALTSDMDAEQSTDIISGNVAITFNNMDLYNENIKFSYHIYDDAGKDLAFENERIPVMLEGNSVVVPFAFNKKEVISVAELKKFKIVFDLVDEQNVFWFSSNTNVKFATCEVLYSNYFVSAFKNLWISVIEHQKIRFGANLVAIGLFVYMLAKYKKEYAA